MMLEPLLSTPIVRTFIWQSIGFVGIFGLREIGIHHLNHALLFIGWLSSIIYFMLRTNPDMVFYLRASLKWTHGLILLSLFLCIASSYLTISVDRQLLATFKNTHFAYMEFTYIATKSFDIAFQKLGFAMYVFDLLKREVAMQWIQLSSAALLFASHTATVFSLPTTVAVIFMVAAAAGGLIFPKTISHPKGGFVPSFTLHWLYYFGLGVAFNLSLRA